MATSSLYKDFVITTREEAKGLADLLDSFDETNLPQQQASALYYEPSKEEMQTLIQKWRENRQRAIANVSLDLNRHPRALAFSKKYCLTLSAHSLILYVTEPTKVNGFAILKSVGLFLWARYLLTSQHYQFLSRLQGWKAGVLSWTTKHLPKARSAT